MKVLNVVCDLGLGGTQRAAVNYAVSCTELGHESRLLALGDGPRRGLLMASGVAVQAGSQPLAELLQPWGASWSPDVLVLHSLGLPPDVVLTLAARWPEATVVEQNVFSTPSPWSTVVDLSFQLSPWAQWLYSTRGGDGAKAPVVPNPVLTERLQRDPERGGRLRRSLGVPADARVIGRVGQPLAYKWSPRLLDVFSAAARSHRNAHLLLVGAPEALAAAALSGPFADRVHVVERVTTDDELTAAYSAMDVFAHIARQGESFGYVLAEAAAFEVPVVTMATPWADNSQGEVCGPAGLVAGTVQEFTRQTLALLEDGELHSRLAAAGPGRAAEFDSRRVTERALELALGAQAALQPFTREDARAEYRNVPGVPTWAARLVGTGRQEALAATTGNESWAWVATNWANRLGVSRHGFRRRQPR